MRGEAEAAFEAFVAAHAGDLLRTAVLLTRDSSSPRNRASGGRRYAGQRRAARRYRYPPAAARATPSTT